MPTKIPWTDETWSPVTGCTKVSSGCTNCYAARLACGRLKNHPRYQGLAVKGNWTEEIRLHPDHLDKPLHWRKPRMCFVCSMSDLFHEGVPNEFIDQVLAVTGIPNIHSGVLHTHQILTKRPERMLNYMLEVDPSKLAELAVDVAELQWGPVIGGNAEYWKERNGPVIRTEFDRWPLPKVWLGTTVENQGQDKRIRFLLDTPAAVRFVSLEPLLGPITLPWLRHGLLDPEYYNVIDWVIVGAETGPGARYMDPDWARDILDQCRAAGVPFFMKQMSNKEPIPEDLMIREYPDEHV